MTDKDPIAEVIAASRARSITVLQRCGEDYEDPDTGATSPQYIVVVNGIEQFVYTADEIMERLKELPTA